MTVEASGFKAFVRTGILLQLRENVRVDAQLQIGQVSDSIEVTGVASLVESYSTVRGEVIENKRITELPLNRRNPLQLAALVTGVTSISTRIARDAGNRNGNYVNVNGSRSNETDYQLNGVRFAGSSNHSGLNYPSPDALQEFKLITNPNSAEYGMWSGAVFTAVTRSGTNQCPRFAVRVLLALDKLNARNFFCRNRTHTAAESIWRERRGTHHQATSCLLSALTRDFVCATRFWLRRLLSRRMSVPDSLPVPHRSADPRSGQPFATDSRGRYVIPQDRFNVVSKNLLDKFVPTAPSNTVLITTGSAQKSM